MLTRDSFGTMNYYLTDPRGKKVLSFIKDNNELFWDAVNALQFYRGLHNITTSNRLACFRAVATIVICATYEKEKYLKESAMRHLRELISSQGLTCLVREKYRRNGV